MTRWTIGLLAALALMSGAAGAADDPASVEKRLADAQRRLEDAAREVAELSGEAAGPAYYRAFEGMRFGRKRAMLGVMRGTAVHAFELVLEESLERFTDDERRDSLRGGVEVRAVCE